MRREAKKLENEDFKVKVMGMDLAAVLQTDCEVSVIIEHEIVPIRIDVDTLSKKITFRYSTGPGFEQKTYTVRQLIDYIKKDKRK